MAAPKLTPNGRKLLNAELRKPRRAPTPRELKAFAKKYTVHIMTVRRYAKKIYPTSGRKPNAKGPARRKKGPARGRPVDAPVLLDVIPLKVVLDNGTKRYDVADVICGNPEFLRKKLLGVLRSWGRKHLRKEGK